MWRTNPKHWARFKGVHCNVSGFACASSHTERWDELDNLQVPDDISESDKTAAQDALDFYWGLSLLARRLLFKQSRSSSVFISVI